MALSLAEAENGYPVALIGRNVQIPSSSPGVSLLNESQGEYNNYVTNVINSKNGLRRATKYRRNIMTVNAGGQMLATLADNLCLGTVDTLYVVEQHPGRIDNAARMAERLKIDPEALVLNQGSFLDTPDSQMLELSTKRLDYIIFGLGSPSQDRLKRNGTCRVEEEVIKAYRLLRVGGSLIIAPRLGDLQCVDLTLPWTSLQVNQDIPSQRIGRFQALRATRLR